MQKGPCRHCLHHVRLRLLRGPLLTLFPYTTLFRSLNTVRRRCIPGRDRLGGCSARPSRSLPRSEEHTTELQSQSNLVCRLLLEQKHSSASTSAPCPRLKSGTTPSSRRRNNTAPAKT